MEQAAAGYAMYVIAAPTDKADEIARALVRERLAACAQVTAPVRSVYWWQEKLQEGDETLIFLKSTAAAREAIAAALSRLHPYAVPELISLPIAWGEKKYLDWIDAEVRIATAASGPEAQA